MIDEGTVKRVAALARVELAPEAVPGLVTELNAFLGLIAGLDKAPVEPTTEPASHHAPAPWRADEPKAPLGAENAVAGAPGGQGDVFLVPKVVT